MLIFIICQFLSICLNPRRSLQISVSCEILLVCMYNKRYLYREVLYVNGDGTSALNDLHIITDTRVSRRYGTRKNFGFNLRIKMCLCTSKTLSYSIRVYLYGADIPLRHWHYVHYKKSTEPCFTLLKIKLLRC